MLAFAAGARLGHYEISAVLGVGGMGEVYRARDTRLGRDIAIKVLPERLAADASRLRRFEQEARLASSLNHPNIVTIYDIGEVESVHFIAMELVDGQTLRTLLGSGPLPVAQAVDLATQVADGLGKAHGAGIVHRDLKPENVMVTRDGFAKILDFGVGKLSAALSGPDPEGETVEYTPGGRTNPGTIIGTVDYMSPEQAAGRTVDFRSDQFSFGLVMYEALTGRVAFRRETAVQTMSAIIAEEARPIGSVNPLVPPRLREIVERCLEKDPAKRYASTVDLALELRAFAKTGSSGEAHPVPALPGVARGRRLAVMIATGLAVGLGLFAIGRQSLPQLLSRMGVAPAGPAKKNVAVFPFRAVGGQRADQAMADGLTATLSSTLTRLTSPALQVAPPEDLRAGRLDTLGAREELGANVGLTGTVERAEGAIRVSCELFDTATSKPMASATVSAADSDPFGLQDRLLDTALAMLSIDVPVRERRALVPRDTAVPDAGALYLQARGFLQYYEKPENVDAAIDAFSGALKLDAKYARAAAGLGEAYSRRYEIAEDPQWIAPALDGCTRALAADAQLSAGHVCAGRVYDGTGRYEEAVGEFQKTLQTEPTSDEAYAGLGHAQEKLGQTAEAETTYRRAIALRPQYWVNYNRLGHFYFNQARYGDAAEMFSRVVALAPDSFRGYSNLGGAYIQLGRYDDAIAALEHSVTIRPNAVTDSNLGTAYFNRGRYGEAARIFEKAVELDAANYELWGNLGDAYYFAPGERQKAAGAYEKAIGLGDRQLAVNARNAALLADLANYHAMIGHRAEALDFVGRAHQRAPRDAFVQFRSAMALNQLGDSDRALDTLEQARASGFSMTVVRDTPNFSNLWKYQRFQDLLRGQ